MLPLPLQFGTLRREQNIEIDNTAQSRYEDHIPRVHKETHTGM